MTTQPCVPPLVAAAAAPAPDSSAAAPPPRGRPSWSGLLRLSLVAVPVKAYPALSSADVVHLHQLHADCGQRIRHQKHCPLHGPVEAAALISGYEYAPDQYVPVQPEELDKLRPARDKALVLEQFLAAGQVDPVRFAGRSLYVLPDGLAARHPYAVLAQALQQASQWALGRAVLAGKRQLVLVRPHGRLLVLDVLHDPAAVRPAPDAQAELPDNSATAQELRLARTLIDAASGPLDWTRYRDATAAELAALLEAKLAGRPLTPPPDEPAAVLRLLDALKQSVAAVQERPQPPQARPRSPRAPRRTRP